VNDIIGIFQLSIANLQSIITDRKRDMDYETYGT